LRRGQATVLAQVSLEVGEEIVVLTGPSAAGKSSLLRAVLGLDTPSEGVIRIADRIVSNGGGQLIAPEARNVAMVFQDLALWPHLTVAGNLALGLQARGVLHSERERRIAEALGWVGLADKAEHRPLQLSGGEQQRVAIARALVLQPLAMLLDEPLGNLDIERKAELLELFARLLHERRMPTLYVTHDPFEAAALADRIIVLEAGRIVQAGTLQSLLHESATPFVAMFARACAAAKPSATAITRAHP
jgi:ABC-type sugar transport system ATPase subunit